MKHQFCWVDLTTPDAEGAKAFYGKLFDWTSEVSQGAKGPYLMLSYQGQQVGGMMEMSIPGVPPHWTGYIEVESVDKAAERAVELGGKICVPATDAGTSGRMGMIIDPTGATFALWEPKTKMPALREAPHSNCWEELMSTDPAVSQTFYCGLFDWTAHPEQFGDVSYITFKSGDKSVGGLMAMPAQLQSQGVPPHWNTYFAVRDCDAIVASSKELGGECVSGPYGLAKVGRFAVLKDPQGGHFCVLQPDPAMAPA